MELQFYPLDIDSLVIDGKDYVRLFGRTIDGKRICVFEQFDNYFWVIPDRENVEWVRKQIECIKVKDDQKVVYVKKTELHTKKFFGKTVKAVKIILNTSKDLRLISQEVKNIRGYGSRKEIDINLYKKYLIENKITPLTLCKVDGKVIESELEVDICVKGHVVQEEEEIIQDVKVLSFDIETADPVLSNQGVDVPIVMIGLSGSDGFKKCITWQKFDTKEDIEFASNETEMLIKFRDIIKDYKPDYIVGYYSDGFDWPHIKTRADLLKVNLDLGLDKSRIKFKRGISSSIKINGIPHIDVCGFVKQIMSGDVASGSLQTQSYSLDSVAEEILGEKKIDVDITKLRDCWDNNENLEEFCLYNIKDAELCLRIFERILPNITELVKIVSLPIYDVSKMSFGQLIENYLMKRTRDFNEIIPGRPTYNEREGRTYNTYTGGFVFEPKPGLYENLAVFDFRGLHPSIISAHNICLSTITDANEDAKETPEIDGEKYYFNYKEEGFIPHIVKELIERRIRIKAMIKEKDDPVLKARSYALKIIAAGFHGYMGYAGARWYSIDCAAGILSYARHYIKKLIFQAQKFGFNVIYGDTDSVFVEMGDKNKDDALRFLDEFNSKLPSLMELELENFYERGIFVCKKVGTKGAKKKYALISEGKIKVRGFETVRRDWSYISRDIQKEVIKIILEEKDLGKALNYVKGKIEKIKNKEMDINDMVIKTQLKKKIEEYESIGPHVAVARQMLQKNIRVIPGSIISYVITEGKGLIRDKAKLVEDAKNYDAEYYINHQVLPSVENIFEAVGYKKEDLLSKGNQVRLGEF